MCSKIIYYFIKNVATDIAMSFKACCFELLLGEALIRSITGEKNLSDFMGPETTEK